MNFLHDPTTLSTLHVTLMSLLMSAYVDNPIYQWPPNYLTNEPYCRRPIYNTNACCASSLDTLQAFDYIIVGSGPAGSTIAYRLVNQFPDRKILLIESGAEPSVESITPKTWAFNLNTTGTYNYFAEKSSEYSNAFKSGTNCMCGNQIGGSTGINAMMYVCGTDRNYNDWAAMTGDKSWNYRSMLPLIKRGQNMQDPTLTSGKCAAYHDTKGPLVVTSSTYDRNEDSLWPVLKAVAAEKGQRELPEINCGPPYTGLVHVQSTVYSGERNSAARAFLVPIRHRPNFYYMKESFVDKVHLSKSEGNLRVTGVSVLTQQSQCEQMTLKAKREVVLSAGAYGTPQILLRSGIGRESDLRACDIPQMKDLPVGRNLADHFLTVHFFTMPGGQTDSAEGAGAFFMHHAERFGQSQDGFFTTSSLNFHWFVNTRDPASRYPDIQLIFGLYDQNLLDFDVLMSEKIGLKDEFAAQLIEANKKHAIVQVVSVLLHPESRGSVKLRDCKDPFAPPVINGSYLSTKADVDTVLGGINKLNEFMSSAAAKDANIRPLHMQIPECDVHELNSESYNRCYIKYWSQNLWHPAGTCRMGLSSTDNVVDSKLRVFGVKESSTGPMLRVADASVMPMMPSGNTQCPTYAIGEKAAATIIADNL